VGGRREGGSKMKTHPASREKLRSPYLVYVPPIENLLRPILKKSEFTHQIKLVFSGTSIIAKPSEARKRVPQPRSQSLSLLTSSGSYCYWSAASFRALKLPQN